MIIGDLLNHHCGGIPLDVNLLASVESEFLGNLHLTNLQTDRALQDLLDLALD